MLLHNIFEASPSIDKAKEDRQKDAVVGFSLLLHLDLLDSGSSRCYYLPVNQEETLES